MKVTLLGFTVPSHVIARILATDAHMPTQTHTFAWAVVESLRCAGADVTLLSAEPITSYPGNPRRVVRGSSFTQDGVVGRTLPFVNVAILKHLTRLAAALGPGTLAMRRWRPDAILVHGVHSPFLLAARCHRRLLGIPVVTILTDPPGVILPSDGKLVSAMKRVDRYVVRWLLRGHDGVIALTAPLAEHLAPGAPNLVMEGIVRELPDNSVESVGLSLEGPATVVYAGGLSRAYGVGRLLEAVRTLPDGVARLTLFGRGELEDEVRRVAAGDDRIEPPRFADRAEVLMAYARADVLVQPRPVEQDFVRFSFPSKLMEYLASGTPVVTTRLPGIPDEYGDHVEWADPDDVDGLREAIARLIALGPEGRRERGRQAREFVWSTRGPAAQGRRMLDFLQALVERSPRPPAEGH